MKKTLMILIVSFFLFACWTVTLAAEMPKEGSGSGATYFTQTFNVHAQGQAYVQINYDARGVTVSDNETSPFHLASVQCVGSLQAVKGVVKDFGLCTYTRPDGDKIYMSYEASGQWGKGVKGTSIITGGTGKCEGMTGTGEFTRTALQAPVEGAGASFSKSTATWKLP
jgi:hypothetical protein